MKTADRAMRHASEKFVAASDTAAKMQGLPARHIFHYHCVESTGKLVWRCLNGAVNRVLPGIPGHVSTKRRDAVSQSTAGASSEGLWGEQGRAEEDEEEKE
jgi:hypothetical protein